MYELIQNMTNLPQEFEYINAILTLIIYTFSFLTTMEIITLPFKFLNKC